MIVRQNTAEAKTMLRFLATMLVVLLSFPAFAETDDKPDNNGKEKKGDKEDKDDKKEKKDKKPPRTLFEWQPGGKKDDKENGENGDKKEEEEDEDEDTIETDRPDFTEASSTVGKGRIQLESGYTFFNDRENGVKTRAHSYPEALLRIGMFAEWFELRLGQNYNNIRSTGGDGGVLIANPGTAPVQLSGSANGFQDLYLGVKLMLTEQKECLPEMSLIIQTTVPSGAQTLTADKMLPGVNLLYGWDIIKDCWTLGGSTQANRAVDEGGHSHVECAQSLTMGFRFTKKLAMYTEYFGFYPTGAIEPDTTAQHFADGGFTYLVTNNFQLDIRVGVGLNKHADDYFTGAGFAVRY